jgi:phosphoribosylanthranilate isomerase
MSDASRHPKTDEAPYHSRRTRVKICGFSRPEDARLAVALGADALGLVFHDPSPRNVTAEQARRIVEGLPPFVTVVGLFVNAQRDRVDAVLNHVRIDLLQFHGDETQAECEGFGRPWIKALRMRPGLDLAAEVRDYPAASGFLVDAWHPDAMGGTGEAFDWSLLPASLAGGLILAGGLTPANVSAALTTVRPFAVDVSSGVEAGKGIKDAGKMADFLNEVQQFDYRANSD